VSGARGQVGRHIGPRQRRAFAEAIRALLEAEPDITLTELTRRTGASNNLVVQVRQRWREAKERAA
jgi:hypothetical protein